MSTKITLTKNNSLGFPIKHLLRLTDKNGIIEHCVGTVPDLSEGYSTDDNARALQLALRLGEKKLVPIYLKFLLSAQTPKGFHQDLNDDMTWKDDDGVFEGYGRAMAALGEASVTAPEEDQRQIAASVFDGQEPLIKEVKYPRVMAQIIIGLSYRIKSDMQHTVDKLEKFYLDNSDASWKWYEDSLTYDNGRLPLAMFTAYQILNEKKYLNIASESLDFLIEKTYNSTKKMFSFPGFNGWYKKNGEKSLFGQQPVEAGSMVEACVKAFEITQDKKYLDKAYEAFSWYSGNNVSGLSLIDDASGGIYDGIDTNGINPNEGAESIVSYLTAKLLLDRLHI